MTLRSAIATVLGTYESKMAVERLDAPLAATAELDRAELAAADHGVDLGLGGSEFVGDLVEGQEAGAGTGRRAWVGSVAVSGTRPGLPCAPGRDPACRSAPLGAT